VTSNRTTGEGLVTRPMLVLFALLLSLPLWIERVGLYQYLGIEIVTWMIYALGFNLLLGYTGLPSFGHGAYFGVGAYAFGLVQLRLVESLWLGLVAGVVAAMVAGLLVAGLISHRRGIYYALMTIACGQVFWFVSVKWHSVTGGEDGLLNIARPTLSLAGFSVSLRANLALYYVAVAVLALTVVGLWRLVHSRFGKALQAIKQNEMRAGFVGYNVWLYKCLVFTLSAGIAGLAGSLFAMAQKSAYPDVMSLHSAGLIVMMTLIGGGFVSFWGPVVGTAVFFLARDLLGAVTETWLLWYGLMFMGIVLFKPEGIVGAWQDLVRRRRAGRGGSAGFLSRFWS
jgi:branched-chain amino acid transport system permease protein